MLCATLKVPHEKALDEANRHADLIELQIDTLSKENLSQLRKQCVKPVIFKATHVDYSILALKPDYIDLPHTIGAQEFQEIAQHFPQIKRICSYHDFERSGDLDAILAALSEKKADIYKIAVLAQTITDSLKMLLFVKKTGCIGLCMGELGTITRILAPVFGAPWTYAPLSEEQRTAPGQLLLHELAECYHFRTLSPKTALYGLIGNPVSFSASHQTHNFAFKELELDAVYVKMQVEKGELFNTLPLLKELGFRGLSVTMPLKEEAAYSVQPLHLPAVNTLSLERERPQGWNTDGVAALDLLEKKISVQGERVVLLGAGGTAWAIAAEAKKRGAQLIILNRSFTRALFLADEVGGEAYPLEAFSEVAKRGYAILINCTPIGMGDDASLPVPAAALLEKKIVMDVVSKKGLTPFLTAAKEKGCILLEGMELFIQQAVYQFCHWFGVENG